MCLKLTACLPRSLPLTPIQYWQVVKLWQTGDSNSFDEVLSHTNSTLSQSTSRPPAGQPLNSRHPLTRVFSLRRLLQPFRYRRHCRIPPQYDVFLYLFLLHSPLADPSLWPRRQNDGFFVPHIDNSNDNIFRHHFEREKKVRNIHQRETEDRRGIQKHCGDPSEPQQWQAVASTTSAGGAGVSAQQK